MVHLDICVSCRLGLASAGRHVTTTLNAKVALLNTKNYIKSESVVSN